VWTTLQQFTAGGAELAAPRSSPRFGLWPQRKPAPPERSFALRRLVFLASLPPLLAVAWVGALWGPALLTILVLAGAHYYSWRAAQKEEANSLIRLIVFVTLHLAVIYMCVGFYAGLTLPQAQFALYAQAITAFDLRRRMKPRLRLLPVHPRLPRSGPRRLLPRRDRRWDAKRKAQAARRRTQPSTFHFPLPTP
jgi:hypothetical protein